MRNAASAQYELLELGPDRVVRPVALGGEDELLDTWGLLPDQFCEPTRLRYSSTVARWAPASSGFWTTACGRLHRDGGHARRASRRGPRPWPAATSAAAAARSSPTSASAAAIVSLRRGLGLGPGVVDDAAGLDPGAGQRGLVLGEGRVGLGRRRLGLGQVATDLVVALGHGLLDRREQDELHQRPQQRRT